MDSTKKRIHCFTALLISACLLGGIASAETYYVASDGSNQNNGLSEQAPFATVAEGIKAAQDQDIVLLRRGDVFYESIKKVTAAITIGAYGDASQPRPILSGARPITGWSLWKNNIYVADLSDTIYALYADNEFMQLARYPNKGWIRQEQEGGVATRTVLAPSLLDHPRNAGDYWKDAIVVHKEWSWYIRRYKVTNYDASQGALTLHRNLKRNGGPGWKFFLMNHLPELDTIGECYFDLSAMKVYLRPPGDKDPNEILVEGVVEQKAADLNNPGITVQDIWIRHYRDYSFNLNKKAKITRCTFSGIGGVKGGKGLKAWANPNYDLNAKGSKITDCRFEGINGIAVAWKELDVANEQTEFVRDTFLNISMHPGYHETQYENLSHGAVVAFGGKDFAVRECVFDSICYSAFIPLDDRSIFERNIVRNAMYWLVDGGAVYVGGDSAIIRNNLIFDCRGKFELQGDNRQVNLAHGIWPEFLEQADGTFHSGMIIENNTVVNSGGYGIYLPNNYGAVVKNNVLFGNDNNQMRLGGHENRYVAKGVMQNHIIEDNVFCSDADSSQTFLFLTDWEQDYGLMRNNFFYNPYNDTNIFSWGSWGTKKIPLTFERFQATYPAWSDKSPVTLSPIRPANADIDDSTGLPVLFVNKTGQSKVFSLGSRKYLDIHGDTVSGSIQVEPFYSKVLIATENEAAGSIVDKVGFKNSPFTYSRDGRLMLRVTAPEQCAFVMEIHNSLGQLVRRAERNMGREETATITWDETSESMQRPANGFYFISVSFVGRNMIENAVWKTCVVR